MHRIRLACLLMLLAPPLAVAEEEAVQISGMSIVGNDEAPKSLYIVPWKSSELGVETDLSANLLNDGMRSVDKDVFMRQLDFYEVSSRD